MRAVTSTALEPPAAGGQEKSELDEIAGDMGQHPRLSWEELGDIAHRLYGTTADLWTVTLVSEGGPEPGDVRRRLRGEWNLVQDPISGIWFCPLSRRQ